MRKVLLVLAIAALLAPAGARAEADGCIAVGSHSYVPPQPWQCHYLATGPGVYVAATTNPFVIYVERTGQPDKLILVSRTIPGRATTGKLATLPGDDVFVSISCWDYVLAKPCPPGSLAGGRDGTLYAQSSL